MMFWVVVEHQVLALIKNKKALLDQYKLFISMTINGMIINQEIVKTTCQFQVRIPSVLKYHVPPKVTPHNDLVQV
jgi:hypothetical protein